MTRSQVLRALASNRAVRERAATRQLRLIGLARDAGVSSTEIGEATGLSESRVRQLAPRK